MARKFYVINIPYFGTDENCEEATAKFKQRIEELCEFVTIDYSCSWWGSRDLDRDYIECSDQEFEEISEELSEVWKQVASEIAEEYGQ